MDKHYICVEENVIDCRTTFNILAVRHTWEEAVDVLSLCISEAKAIAEENDYPVLMDSISEFDAGDEENHITVYIKIINGKS